MAERTPPGKRAPASSGEGSPSPKRGSGPRTAPDAREARRAHLTGRAAILAVVACAIALSLAYPVREYIAQRREIAALRVQERQAQQQVEQLARQKQRLGDEAYIKQEARRRLHMCDPGARCYVVLGAEPGDEGAASRRGRPPTPPWYVTLWRSVDAADRRR